MKTTQYTLIALCMFVGGVSLVSAQYYQYPYYNQYTNQYSYNTSYSSQYYRDGHHHYGTNDYDDYDDYPHTYTQGCSLYQYNPYTHSTSYMGSICTPSYQQYQYTYTPTYYTSYPYMYNTTSYQAYPNNNYNTYYYSNGSWYPSSNYNNYQSNNCYYQNGYMVCY